MDSKQTIAHIKTKMRAQKPSAEALTITPEVAEWLIEQKWESNRDLQQATVDRYVRILKHGQWKMTGQGIIVSKSGKMIDGQHRCWAIFDSGITADMMVTFGIDEDASRDIDCGAVRSLAYRSGFTNAQTAALNFIVKLGYGAVESTQANVRAIAHVYLKPVDALLALQSRKTPMLRQAAIVAAGAIWHKAGMDGYVENMYVGLLSLDSGSLPPVGRSFLRQCVETGERTRRTGGMDLFVRAFKTFDPQAAQISKLQLKDGIPTLEQARAMIQKAVHSSGVTFDAKVVSTQRGVGKKSVATKSKKVK